MNKRDWFYSLTIISAMLILTSLPAYAEVLELHTDSKSYLKGDNITFTGNVERKNSGIVSIVIRDSNDNFVLLTQAETDHNYFFKKTIQVTEQFKSFGTYTATGFILNMTAGKITQFDLNKNTAESIIMTDDNIDNSVKINSSHEDNIETSSQNRIVNQPAFIDKNKTPQYYLERYYNEPEYKAWFDKNYPDYTIEEAVGYEGNKYKAPPPIQKNLIPKAEAISSNTAVTNSNNGEVAQIVLAIAALGILFGATYGIKKKVDSNSKQISINRNTIRKKIINPIIGGNPLDILQIRLAKGEISIEEYNILKKELQT